jgi:hypothetical protein
LMNSMSLVLDEFYKHLKVITYFLSQTLVPILHYYYRPSVSQA